MKEKVLYKTNSLSINLFIFFFGFVFFSLIIWYLFNTLKTNKEDDDIIAVYILSSIFSIGALGCLFCFFKTQIIKLTNKSLIISYQFLPFSKKILIEDIVNFKQKPLPVKRSRYLFDKGTTVHTFFETLVKLKNDKEIKIYSLSEFDFKKIRRLMEKIERGQNQLEVDELAPVDFFSQNLSIIMFLIMMLILIGGLSKALIFN